MDFFQRQELARKQTRWLVLYFALAVAGTIATVYLVTALAFNYTSNSLGNEFNYVSLWDSQLFFGVTLATLAIIVCGSVYKITSLASGGAVVAASMGARFLAANTTQPDERRLLNVVEEMAIASGTPMPQVFVLDDSNTINAFAAGHSTNDMVICVTRGALRELTRDELQGVVGHEFSHILNGDMRINLQLMGYVFGILCIAMIGRILMRVRSSGGGKKGGNPLPLIGLALFLIGYIGVFFANLIKSAINRQREFLADASSVQFTRNPSGIVNTLKKVAAKGSLVNATEAEEASHFFFANALTDPLFDLMATHPPVDERIRAIDPNWDGRYTVDKTFTSDVDKKTASCAKKTGFPSELTNALGVGILATATAGADAAPGAPILNRTALLKTVGTATPKHLDYATGLLNQIPSEITAAARQPMTAVALFYGLLLQTDPAARAAQLALLNDQPAILSEVQKLLSALDALDRRAKLPLVTLSVTALRGLSAGQYDQFRNTLDALIASDGQVELFEFMVQKIVQRRLDPSFGKGTKPNVQYYAIKPVLHESLILLSALAQFGNNDPEQVQNAFLKGALELPFRKGDLQLLAPADCGIGAIDPALDRLNETSAPIKKMILSACAQTVAADGAIAENEAELLRAIADTLDCPLPPFLSLEAA